MRSDSHSSCFPHLRNECKQDHGETLAFEGQLQAASQQDEREADYTDVTSFCIGVVLHPFFSEKVTREATKHNHPNEGRHLNLVLEAGDAQGPERPALYCAAVHEDLIKDTTDGPDENNYEQSPYLLAERSRLLDCRF